MKCLSCLCCLIFLLANNKATAHFQNKIITIDAINITGNKKTKANTILRQLAFKKGDEIEVADTTKIIERSTNRLLNTSLFIAVNISFTKSKFDNKNTIANVEVAERWYLFPTPYFNIADRNFNAWWRQYNFNLKRVDVGAQLKHFNLTGRNDVLEIVAYGGFSGNLKLEYRLPQIGKKQIYGFETAVKYKRHRTTLINAVDNQQVFYPTTIPDVFEQPTLQEFSASVLVSRQKNVNIKKLLGVRYQNNKISTTIQQLENTPNFFPNNELQFKYFALLASIEFDYRDNATYAKKGWHYKTAFEQIGLGLLNAAQQTKLTTNTTLYYSFNKRFSILSNLKWQLSHQNQPNYYLTEAMGYNSNDIRAYERFVIDGQHFVLQRNAFRYELLNFTIKPPLLHKIKQIQQIPIAILPKVYFEHGKVWDKYFSTQNSLNNQWLYGFGFGIDVVTFYDLVASMEYSFTKNGLGSFVLQFDYSY